MHFCILLRRWYIFALSPMSARGQEHSTDNPDNSEDHLGAAHFQSGEWKEVRKAGNKDGQLSEELSERTISVKYGKG